MSERRNDADIRCQCGEVLAVLSRNGEYLKPIPGSRIRAIGRSREVVVTCQHCRMKRSFANVTVDGIAVPDPLRVRPVKHPEPVVR